MVGRCAPKSAVFVDLEAGVDGRRSVRSLYNGDRSSRVEGAFTPWRPRLRTSVWVIVVLALLRPRSCWIADVMAALEQAGRKGVAQGVGGRQLGDAGGPAALRTAPWTTFTWRW
jgi:hypothetical protein